MWNSAEELHLESYLFLFVSIKNKFYFSLEAGCWLAGS